MPYTVNVWFCLLIFQMYLVNNSHLLSYLHWNNNLHTYLRKICVRPWLRNRWFICCSSHWFYSINVACVKYFVCLVSYKELLVSDWEKAFWVYFSVDHRSILCPAVISRFFYKICLDSMDNSQSFFWYRWIMPWSLPMQCGKAYCTLKCVHNYKICQPVIHIYHKSFENFSCSQRPILYMNLVIIAWKAIITFCND